MSWTARVDLGALIDERCSRSTVVSRTAHIGIVAGIDVPCNWSTL